MVLDHICHSVLLNLFHLHRKPDGLKLIAGALPSLLTSCSVNDDAIISKN